MLRDCARRLFSIPIQRNPTELVPSIHRIFHLPVNFIKTATALCVSLLLSAASLVGKIWIWPGAPTVRVFCENIEKFL